MANKVSKPKMQIEDVYTDRPAPPYVVEAGERALIQFIIRQRKEEVLIMPVLTGEKIGGPGEEQGVFEAG